MRITRTVALSVLTILLIVENPVFADELTGSPKIIDGDTVKVAGEKIRLHGIDAPEKNQICKKADHTGYRCGELATVGLADIVGSNVINCSAENRDRYGRWISVCFVGANNVNAEMVRRGWAVAYRKYSLDYVDEEIIAKSGKKGIWQGRFVMPWDWRRGIRE